MSKIFRSDQTVSDSENVRPIVIRSMRPETQEGMQETISMDAVLLERDRLLGEAKKKMDAELQSIERMRETVAADIAAMQEAWQQEKAALQQQAYEEGFQVGYEEGRSKALADMSGAIEKANAITEMSEENASKYIDSQERVILELAMRAASRILGKAIEDDEETFLSIVRRGLKEAREMKDIRLYVPTDRYRLVSENRAELAAIFPPDVPFLIFANEDFDQDECTIETNHGRIVVGIDEQLNELKEALVELLESGE